MAPLIQAVLTLIVIGVILWLINFIPIASSIKSIINIVVVIAVIIWLLSFFGILNIYSR